MNGMRLTPLMKNDSSGFRRQVPEASRPYRLPGAAVVAPLAFIIANLLIYWSGFEGAVKPPVNTGNIPFWWDILVVAGFSLIIYYWAQVVQLPREEMLELVGRQAAAPPAEQALPPA